MAKDGEYKHGGHPCGGPGGLEALQTVDQALDYPKVKMIYSLCYTLALFAFSSLVTSAPTNHDVSSPHLRRQLAPPEQGTYTFQGCNRTAEQGRVRPLMLGHVRPDMEGIIAEVRKGVNSTLFELFFKDNANIEPVATLFDRIARFDTFKMPDINYGNRVEPGRSVEVEFLCIIPERELTIRPLDWDWWADKRNLTGTNSSNLWTTESAQVSPDIFIWPSYFDLALTPELPTPASCPPVGQSVGDLDATKEHDDKLVHTRYGSLIRGLANKYLNPNPVKDNLGIQDAINLDAAASLANPANYGHFASGESCTLFSP